MKKSLDSDEEPSPLQIEKVLVNPKFYSERANKKVEAEMIQRPKKKIEENSDKREIKDSADDSVEYKKFYTTANLPSTPEMAKKKEFFKTSAVEPEMESPELEDGYRTDEIREGEEIKQEEVDHLVHFPNPSVTANSKRDMKEVEMSYKNYSPREMIQGQKSIGILSEGSVKPRKGDRTPKSHQSEMKEKRMIKLEKDLKQENILNNSNNLNNLNNVDTIQAPMHLQSRPQNNQNFDEEIENEDNELSEINPIPLHVVPHPESPSAPMEKTKTLMTSYPGEKNFQVYDIQQLSYDLVKEYSHLKIDKDETFMRRMLFDVFKRQTKEERMNKLIDKNKIRIDENERIKTFNRLIEDANRRLEAQERIEKMKDNLDNNTTLTNKKYKSEEWEEIYDERFLKYKLDREKKNLEKTKEKVIKDKEEEDRIVENTKAKKVPSHVINSIAKRMYEEAERRKLKLEEIRRKGGLEEEQEILNTKDRDDTPSRYKKYKSTQKYKFQVISN